MYMKRNFAIPLIQKRALEAMRIEKEVGVLYEIEVLAYGSSGCVCCTIGKLHLSNYYGRSDLPLFHVDTDTYSIWLVSQHRIWM